MTLIEILIVMAIIAIVMAGVMLGSGQLSSARLRQSSALVTGGVKAGYTRATAVSKSTRLVFDFESNSMWIEQADRPMVVQSKDKTGTGGADPSTQVEQAAAAESERIVKGPTAPKAHFSAVPQGELGSREPGGKRTLPRGITFRSIQTEHDAEPRIDGRAYLYFWPGGQTERAVIQVRIGTSEKETDTLSLVVSPLTGKVAIKSGPVELKLPTDDKEASERDELGGL